MYNHKDLHVWKKSIEFVTDIYRILQVFPKSELFSLSDQLKRASISISSNIAEWSARWSTKEQLHFFYIARGSCAEIETQLIIAKNLWFINDSDFEALNEKITIIGKMLTKLISSMKDKI